MFDSEINLIEMKQLLRVVVVMFVIEIAGHAVFRYYTQPVLENHIGTNKNAQLFKSKHLMEDHLV